MLQLMLLAIALTGSVVPVSAATKVAVFPFDLRDISQEGELVPQLNEQDVRRLKVAAEELKGLMQRGTNYQVVDMTSLGEDIDKASPFSKCDGCEVTIAKKAGAQLAVTGVVDKWSDALLSLQIFARDTETGKLVKSMSAAIQGNTDELWIHGVRYLWRNRFNVEAPAK